MMNNRLLGLCLLGGVLVCAIPAAFSQEQGDEAATARDRQEAWRERREERREAWVETLREENPALAEELEALREEREAFRESFPDKYPELSALMEERREALQTLRESRFFDRHRGGARHGFFRGGRMGYGPMGIHGI